MPKVMIAEDDFFLAAMLAAFLSANGYEVCGTVGTVKDAIEVGERHRPDLALVDVWLADGGHGREVAARLKRQGGPGILYATGRSGRLGGLGLSQADGDAFLGKPFRPDDLLRALKIVEHIIRTGVAPQPFPDRFHVLEPLAPRDISPS